MTREEFIKQRCEIDKITEEEIEKLLFNLRKILNKYKEIIEKKKEK